MKRKAALAMAICMAVGMLTGCGGPKEAGKAGETKESVAQADTAADADGGEAKNEQAEGSEAKEGNDGEEVVVRIFHHIGEQEGRDQLDKIIEKLESENPGVQYEAQGIDFSQFGTMLKTKIAGGDAPDIIMGRPRVYADLIEAGHIADLSDQPFLKNLSDTTLSSMKVDGKVYGIPLSLGGMGIFYNREVFEKYGVQIPKSHKDLLAAADKFEEAGIIPFAHGFKEGWTAQCDIQSDLYGYPLQQNPKMFEDIQNGTKKFADYPEFRECLQRNADRLSYEGGDDFGTDVSKARSMLINGEAAMFIGGNWDISEFINNKVDDKIGFFATPNTNDSEPVQGLAPDGSFMLYSKSEHKEEALKFLEFWSSEEAFTLWNVNGSNIPCSLDASTDGISPLVADIMEIARNGKTYNYESEPVFSGQFDSTFRAWQEEFAADPDRDVDTYIQKLDDELDAIK